MFQEFIIKSNQDPSSPKDKNSNKHEVRQLQEELMSVKIREAGCLSELKETKQKVMEFETQVTIYLLFYVWYFLEIFFSILG